MQIVAVAINVPLRKLFYYTINQDTQFENKENNQLIGSRVKVPFGRNNKVTIGVVISTDCDLGNKKSKLILKNIQVVYKEQLTTEILYLLNFVSNYYHYPIGQTIFSAIPKAYKQDKFINYIFQDSEIYNKLDKNNNICLSDNQLNISKEIINNLGKFSVNVIYGVTGSGKTEVYMEVIKAVIATNRQVLILVPEINLTPIFLERFKNKFQNYIIGILTSGVSEKERLKSYIEAQWGISNIIIGTRIAVFAQFKSIGLIIIDEEHDPSFKQNDNLRYNARDVGIVRAKIENIPIILGSATLSVETLYNYKKKNYNFYKLEQRAIADAKLPQIKIIDMNNDNSIISNEVVEAIEKRIVSNEISLVFINRRGYSAHICCYACGYLFMCKNCSVNMVYHRSSKQLKCHYCLYQINLPEFCTKCNSQNLQTFGQGTQQIEELLFNKFKTAKILRIDQDSVGNKKNWRQIYKKINENAVNIIVCTQMLSKGHDFHNITLVVALNVDGGFFSYDFRALEHTFAQLIQVAGRAGRGSKNGEFFLQTKYPNHELYQYLVNYDYLGFVNFVLYKRKIFGLPPYTYFVMLRASSKKINKAMDFLTKTSSISMKFKPQNVKMYRPIPSILQRLKNQERAQVLISSFDRNSLHYYLDNLISLIESSFPKYDIKYHIDIDPLEI